VASISVNVLHCYWKWRRLVEGAVLLGPTGCRSSRVPDKLHGLVNSVVAVDRVDAYSETHLLVQVATAFD
jgi:hypothetical protein